ncbi:hypothetical protein [Streptosporangium subroseum]|uniref:hypothetical protein n=1 Tax=Streptosporangium subroseum TaxID=106412 RepID=UPI00308A2D3C|nr:hypothetical protein OHB15_45275 [Streptosporangium subroseum]
MSWRNLRNNHYERAHEPLPHRTSPLVRLWRWRTEIALLAAVVTAVSAVVLSLGKGDWWPFLVLAGTVGAPAASSFGRNWVIAHMWCLVSRHRIQKTCVETGMHTRSGRLPLILWITPTAVGEKALVLARVGICAEDFEAFSGELSSACYARRTEVARHRRWAHLITVEIIRREAAPGLSLGLDRLYGQANWVSLRSGRDLEEVPDTRPAATAFPVAA